MSDNLDLGRVPEGTETPEVLINGAFGKIDGLFTEAFAVDLSAGNGAVTVAQIAAASVLSLDGAAVARSVTLPAAKRILFALNTGAADVTVTRGTASVVIPAGTGATLRLTGAENGLAVIGGGGGGGSTPGAGLPAGGTDGQYLAKLGAEEGEAEWRDLPSSGGGGAVGGGYIPVKPATLAELATIVKSADATVATYADERNFVVRRTDTGVNAAERMGAAMRAVPGSGNWQVVSVIKAPRRNRSNYTRHGIAVRNSATDRWAMLIYGQQSNDPRVQCLELGSTNVVMSGLGATHYCDFIDFVTLRIKLQGGNYTFDYSMDFGTTWNNVYTVSEGSIPTGGRPDQVGIVNQAYTTFTLPNDTASPFFELTTL